MAISPVSQSTSTAAQQVVQQPRQQDPAQTTKAAAEADKARKAQQDQQAQQSQQAPQPVVNTQGQVTGKVVNTFA